ncbi:hypothetical protein [Zavarzinia aquatilis]|uniref:Type II secretion system protein GspC N-terminal domain-containing protein n=1 Tax=Zavarzinia aquatilis TaxID=2211142 RepID=A0A317E704_9PROT|nr:hypothetical protein [Zavarzinia aquatilis]PWR22817.1 hypothetical protein DKG74_10340 [Zavarzinia aquatilis]
MLRFLPAVLACLLLAGLAALQVMLPTGDLPADDAGLAARRPALVEGPAAPEFPEIEARPLFSPDRRPAAGPADTTTAEYFAVIGIGTTAESATALLRIGERDTRRIRPGDEVEGWTVDAILPDAVTLTRDGESLRLTLGAAPAAPSTGSGEPDPRPAEMDTLPDDDLTGDDRPGAPPTAGEMPPGSDRATDPATAPRPDKSWLPPAMQNMPGIERFIEK